MVLWLPESQSTWTLRERSLSILWGALSSKIHSVNSHSTREICTISIGIEGSLHFLTTFWLYLPLQRFPLLKQLERVWINRIQYARIPLYSLVRFAQESGRKSTIWRFVCFIYLNYFIFHRLEQQNFSVWKPVSRWLVVSRQLQTAKDFQGRHWIILGIENTHQQFQSRSGFLP